LKVNRSRNSFSPFTGAFLIPTSSHFYRNNYVLQVFSYEKNYVSSYL
jgi:hypothetical protein